MPIKIPFYRPSLIGKELLYIKEVLTTEHWQGDGPFSEKCSLLLGELTAAKVYLTTSGTHSLELAFMALNLAPGDEVILPSYTFVSTANCLVQLGLKPVFIDIRHDTLNLDESLIEQAISKKTRAILVVHYAGIAAEMDTINAIAKKYGLFVVEDAAQGVNAFYKNCALGSLGDLGAFSFHQTKNFVSGEGGAIVVKNENFLKSIEVHRQKGTNRNQFLRGEVDKYSWVDRGSNYLMSDILAAFLYAQLQSMEEITNKRKELYLYYQNNLFSFSNRNFQIPVIPSNCQSNYHIFYILVENKFVRDRLIAYLKDKGIEAVTHFVPLHNSPGGLKFGEIRSPMPITEKTGNNLLRLPLYTNMTIKDQDYVIKCLKLFFNKSELL